jgi:membrane-associated phospholipid phosphatase
MACTAAQARQGGFKLQAIEAKSLSQEAEIISGPAGYSRLPQSGWRLKSLIRFHLFAAALILSWLWPVTRAWWDQLDEVTFELLNGSLRLGEGWQFFWALANHRTVDLVSGGAWGLIVIWWLWGQPRDIQNKRCAALGGLAMTLMVIPFTAHIIIKFVMNFQRYSPSLVIDGALRLNELVPSFETKDISIYSFPGDHAFILFAVGLFFWILGPRKITVAAWIVAVLFMLPRLVGGAHWLTDNIIGGLAPAAIAASWQLSTPLGYRLMNLCLPLVRLVVALIPKPLRIPDHSEP